MESLQIKRLLFDRIIAASESCNSNQINNLEGQILALTAVLKGEPVASGSSTKSICDYVGIPCNHNGDGTVSFNDVWLKAHFDDAWLKEHEFTED